MSSKLVYFGNVITRTEALVKANVIREPKWLKVCTRFPPLSEPVNPVLPDWENIEQTRTHRVGNFTRLDGHRFDPKEPTEYPRDKQVTHPHQPHHVYFSKDELRRQFYTKHPAQHVQLTYSAECESPCERWMRGEEVVEGKVLSLEEPDQEVWEVFEEIRNNCDISDIDLQNT
ncbi:hypothetical protein ACHWQZ_G018497 [Mnemiopsis leidyi]